jgi:CRISPR-associated protein Csy1
MPAPRVSDTGQAFRAACELHRKGDLPSAAAMLQAILAVDPKHAGAHHRLGVIAHQRGELGDAEEALVRAVELDPREPVYAYTLGLVLHDLRDYLGAAASYRDAITRRPEFAEAWNNLGLALQDAGRLDDARRALEQALRVRPGYAAAEGNLANVLDALGNELAARHREREARVRFRGAWALRPRSLPTALKAALTLPAVPGSAAELDAARADFAQGLEELHAALPSFAELERDAVLDALGRTNFLLAYQGGDDLALQSRYGDFVHALLARAAPEWMQPLARTAVAGRRIRVGFVSRLFHRCTAGLYFKSWITGLDRGAFEVTVVSLSPAEDDVTAEVRAASDRFLAPAGRAAGEIAAAIRGIGADVLVYPELGMDARTFALAALRLAPLQCAGWGHPVTTGLPNVDVFLSAAAVEPPGAAAHYRERLVLLPGLGTAYPRPAVPAPKSRAELGLPATGTLYLFPHSPFKIHPDNDALVARVLAADPGGVLVTFAGQTGEATRAIGERLRATAGIDAARMVVLPVMGHDDYLRVNCACDALLDTLHWSGGNTSLDALACGLPVVTLPGAFMRGRQTAAMLQMAGVPELVARDADDYVRIAVRLGTDATWRAAQSARLAAGAAAVFDRREPIEALARFLATGST